jgi:hypothetical protein
MKMKMPLRLKAFLILPISPIWIMGALIIDHWDDVAGCYEDLFKAIAGTHDIQKREKRERAKK